MATDSSTWMWNQNGGVNGAWRSSGSRSNHSLNSAFVVGTSGACLGFRYTCPVASAIVAVYIMIDTNIGTYGSITMACALNNEASGQATRSGTTQREASSATAMAAAVDQWTKFTFAGSYTPTVGEVLWICPRNTSAAPATNAPAILSHGAYAQGIQSSSARQILGYTTTNGFTTNGSAINTPIVVVEHANGDVYGNPFSTTSTSYYTNNTRKRGIYIPAMQFDREFVSVVFGANANTTSIQLFDDSTGPGGTALNTWSLTADANETINYLTGIKTFDTPLVLQRGKAYRLVQTFGGNSQTPQVLRIEDHASYTSIFNKFYGGHDVCYSTIDDGASGWTDDKTISPAIGLIESRILVPGRGYIGG